MIESEPLAFDGHGWAAAARAAPSTAASVRILTWNIWFGDFMFGDRRAALIAELERRRPDVLCLQEVTQPVLSMLLDEPWLRASYQVSDVAVLDYDVVVLSRLPIAKLAALPLPTEMGRRLVVAELACGLAVATVHLESTRGCAVRRATQLRLIQPALSAFEDVVLVGDMNFPPGAPVESQALDPMFVDVWPALRPGDPGYTVDSVVNEMRGFANSPAQKRIDRVFVRGVRWRPRTIELVGTRPIDGDGTFTSDHFGLEATFTAGTTASRSRSGTAS